MMSESPHIDVYFKSFYCFVSFVFSPSLEEACEDQGISYQDVTGVWSALSPPSGTLRPRQVLTFTESSSLPPRSPGPYLNLIRSRLAGTDGKPIRVQTADRAQILLVSAFVLQYPPPPLTIRKGC